MRYPGGKFRLYQQIISLMPPHRVYIETHLGGGAVLRNKSPALVNIGVDMDLAVVQRFQGLFASNYSFVQRDAEEFLRTYKFNGDELIYADPPYLCSSRRSSRSPYRFDYSDQQHIELLNILRMLPCCVMVSSYPNHLYAELLKDWAQHPISGTSHTGKREEIIWTNFSPAELHDVRFIGATFRERQTIKRKRQRWTRRFLHQPEGVQQAILQDLMSAYCDRLKFKKYECPAN